MFRCPNTECGQGYKMPVGDYFIYNSRDMKRPIITESAQGSNFMRALCLSESVFKDDSTMSLNTNMKSEYKRAILQAHSNNESITCGDCGETHEYEEWLECYKDPLGYDFESNELCFCGEEMMLDLAPNGRYGMYCDKCEQFSKSHKMYSGSGDVKAI